MEAHKMLLGIAVPWMPCWVSVWSLSLAPGAFSVLCTLLPIAQRGYLMGTAPMPFRFILPRIWSLLIHPFTEKYLLNIYYELTAIKNIFKFKF